MKNFELKRKLYQMENAETIIETLNATVIDITQIIKQLIDTNETLEAENQELVQKVIHQENRIYKFKKLVLALTEESSK